MMFTHQVNNAQNPSIPNSQELPGDFSPPGPPPGTDIDPLGTKAVPRPSPIQATPSDINFWICSW